MNPMTTYLLSIANEHAEPGAHFAVGAQQQAADIGHKGADCLICCIWFVVQSKSHTQTRQVTLLYLGTHRLIINKTPHISMYVYYYCDHCIFEITPCIIHF